MVLLGKRRLAENMCSPIKIPNGCGEKFKCLTKNSANGIGDGVKVEGTGEEAKRTFNEPFRDAVESFCPVSPSHRRNHNEIISANG